MTNKWADYQLFKRGVEFIDRGEHLTTVGLNKLVSIKASMNRGLSDKLKKYFSPQLFKESPQYIYRYVGGIQRKLGFEERGVTLVQRPVVQNQSTPDSHWVAGFTAAEGCFFVVIKKSIKSITGESVGLRFIITQHSRDEKFIINCLIKYLGCGKYYSRSSKDYGELIVEKFSDIVGIIIPFFEKFKLQGAKQKDFDNFKRVAAPPGGCKAHLTLPPPSRGRGGEAGIRRDTKNKISNEYSGIMP